MNDTIPCSSLLGWGRGRLCYMRREIREKHLIQLLGEMVHVSWERSVRQCAFFVWVCVYKRGLVPHAHACNLCVSLTGHLGSSLGRWKNKFSLNRQRPITPNEWRLEEDSRLTPVVEKLLCDLEVHGSTSHVREHRLWLKCPPLCWLCSVAQHAVWQTKVGLSPWGSIKAPVSQVMQAL